MPRSTVAVEKRRLGGGANKGAGEHSYEARRTNTKSWRAAMGLASVHPCVFAFSQQLRDWMEELDRGVGGGLREERAKTMQEYEGAVSSLQNTHSRGGAGACTGRWPTR